jgi:hypothetical protein
LRNSLLLPGTTVSERHVRRTNTPASKPLLTAGRGFLIAAVVLLIAAIAPTAWFILNMHDGPPSQRAEIEITIKDYGFDPLVPPNQLRGPGSLYQVVGTSYRKVCPVHAALLEGKLQKSPTPEHVRTRLESANLSLGGNYLRDLNGKLDGARITSIEYTMKNVVVSEIALSHLHEIQNTLLQDKNCDETVQGLLKANVKVCAGYSALSATTSYRVRYESKFGSSAEARIPVIEAVQKKIEADAGSKIEIQGEDELLGENLYYGIQLWEQCITPSTANEPSPLPPRRPNGPQASL